MDDLKAFRSELWESNTTHIRLSAAVEREPHMGGEGSERSPVWAQHTQTSTSSQHTQADQRQSHSAHERETLLSANARCAPPSV